MTQKSKSRGSHGAKAHYAVHGVCVGCGKHKLILNRDEVCPTCLKKTYGFVPFSTDGIPDPAPATAKEKP